MSRRDKYHDVFKRALIKEGWQIIADPYILRVGQKDMKIDLAAQQGPLVAERDGRKILIEIKSFIGLSDVQDLYEAVGQYLFYRTHLAHQQIELEIYLAIPESAYEGIWTEPAGRVMLELQKIQMIVFDVQKEVVIKWIN